MDGTKERVITTNIISLLAGLWLILFPFMFAVTGTSFATNEYIVGIIVAVLSLVRLFAPTEGTGWAGWVNGVAGLWLLISAFVFAGLMVGAVWNNVLIGLLVIIVALWSVMSSTQQSHPKMG